MAQPGRLEKPRGFSIHAYAHGVPLNFDGCMVPVPRLDRHGMGCTSAGQKGIEFLSAIRVVLHRIQVVPHDALFVVSEPDHVGLKCDPSDMPGMRTLVLPVIKYRIEPARAFHLETKLHHPILDRAFDPDRRTMVGPGLCSAERSGLNSKGWHTRLPVSKFSAVKRLFEQNSTFDCNGPSRDRRVSGTRHRCEEKKRKRLHGKRGNFLLNRAFCVKVAVGLRRFMQPGAKAET